MKYKLNETWVNDETTTKLPNGATALGDAEWQDRNGTPRTPTPTEVADSESEAAKSELVRIDLKSIPLMREQLAVMTGASSALKALEAKAVSTRVKVK